MTVSWLNNVYTDYLVAICWSTICASLSSIISIASLYHLFIKDSSSWINELYRNLTATTIIAFTLCCIGDDIHVIIRFLNFPNRFEYDRLETQMATIVDAIYYSANIMFYTLLLLRVMHVLEGMNVMRCIRKQTVSASTYIFSTRYQQKIVSFIIFINRCCCLFIHCLLHYIIFNVRR